jgi:DNA modification methylase
MLTYKLIPTSDLIPYARNSRTHSEAQVTKIASSIKEFGFINPVVTDGKNGIVAGHGRVLAANKLGLKEVPCVEASHLTEAQKRAYVIADNRMALDAGWDIDLLKVEIGDLQGMDFDLSLTGFDPGELENFLAEKTEGLTDPDAVPDVPERAVTVLGDVWLMGNHRLMCGDSTSIDAVDKLMAGGKADMVFTDPPYGISIVKGGKVGGNSLAKTGTYAPVAGDDTIDVAIEAIQVIKTLSAKVEIIWGGNYYANALENSSCWIVWDKDNTGNFADAELAWTNQKTAVRIFKHTWNGMIKASEHGQKRVHPTQKPVILSEWCIDQYGEDCLTVLDLFGGSGSSLMACEKKKKHARMMELDPKYCDVIVKRWQEFTGNKATLESTGQTFEDVASSRYDWKKDSAASYNVAIAEKRKELEAST